MLKYFGWNFVKTVINHYINMQAPVWWPPHIIIIQGVWGLILKVASDTENNT
jgi:hypothetical protein